MRLSALRRRAVQAVRNYFHRDFTAEALINCEEVSPFIRVHLSQLYFALLCASVSSAVGSCLYPTDNLGALLAAFVACVSFISFYLTAPWRKTKRLCFFMLTACFGWATATPWLSWLLNVDTGFVATILLAHSVGFACFYASSKWTLIFELVYFRAQLLYSFLLTITLFVTAAVFGGDSDDFKYLTYPYLVWSMGYVAAYSQEVVVKARRGDEDYVKHAICLYPDFPAFLANLVKELWRLTS